MEAKSKKLPLSNGYKRLSKRLFDVVIALGVLILFSPVLAAIAVLVRLFHGSPVLFRQIRPGLNKRLFGIYKFRTMTDERDHEGKLLPDGRRLTLFGKFLRSTSIDELPELLNVLRGEMSLVGPRPLLKEYLPFYTSHEGIRHTVRPGLTGWAQINGRNYRPWDERLALDVWYVENWSFWLDMKILALTAMKVIRREGVSVDATAVETALHIERGAAGARGTRPHKPNTASDKCVGANGA